MTLNWGWRIAIVYTAFALATLGMVAFTFTQSVELVRPDYYEYSLGHDRRAQILARTKLLQPVVHVDQSNGHVVVDVPAAHANASVQVHFERPNDSSMDLDRRVTVDAEGHIRIPMQDLSDGRWLMTLSWQHDGTDYMYEHSLYW
jgi:hypothetical protein